MLLDLGKSGDQRPGGTVRSVRRQRIERIGHEDDPGRQWNLIAGEPVGIPGPVDALVARAGALADDGMEVELREDVVRRKWMGLDDCPFRLMKRAPLAENLLGDADLADVVKERSDLDGLELLAAVPELLRQRNGNRRDAVEIGRASCRERV